MEMGHILDDPRGYIPQPQFLAGCRQLLADMRAAPQRLHCPQPRGQYRVLPDGHLHPGLELFIQVSGRCRFRFPHEEVDLAPGDALLIPRALAHEERVQRIHNRWCNLVVMFHRERISLHNALANQRDRPIGRTRVTFTTSLSGRVQDWAEDYVHARHGGSTEVAGHLLQAVVSGLLEVLSGEAEADPGTSGYRVSQCRMLVQQQLSDQSLSVRRLAELLDCAADYLSHSFHAQAGEPLSQYINRKRVEYAMSLLRESTLNISEIARAAGYADPGYFSRQFRRQIGLSPRAWRRAEVGRRSQTA